MSKTFSTTLMPENIKMTLRKAFKEIAQMTNQTDRMVELDILRVIALFIVVVVVHIREYTWDFYLLLSPLQIPGLSDYLRYLAIYVGVGLFVFLSGYIQYLSWPITTSRNDVLHFFKRRLLRIMPLYWLAVAMFVYQNIDVTRAILHFFGVQIILAPKYVVPIFTIWFIGLLLIFYLLYPLLSYYAQDFKKFLITSAFILVLFAIIRSSLGIIEIRFFLYYFIFIAGIVACKYFRESMVDPSRVMVLFSGVGLATLILIYFTVFKGQYILELEGAYLDSGTSSYLNHGIFYIISGIFVVNGIILTFIVVLFKFVSQLRNKLSTRWSKYLFLFSYSSYSVFLFHRPFFTIVSRILTGYLHLNLLYKSILIFLSLPLLFVVCYFIQYYLNKVLDLMQKKRR
ncbi:MAG: acyltransferase family protein [Candidatus Ranarchaeia archaeon]|jgi:peptidoglycan/LPS O-acetylase OafA/YrhL